MFGFRPLIRGFFFYISAIPIEHQGGGVGFRPLIRGFFFYEITDNAYMYIGEIVSVPSFGDSFFINYKCAIYNSKRKRFRPLIRGFFFYTVVMICRQV